MAEHKSNLLMKFVERGDKPVFAECALGKHKDDGFMTDFKPQTYANFSNFFELKTFKFGFDVKDEAESKSGPGTPAGGKPHAPQSSLSKVQGEFASWRSATDEDAKKMKFQLEFEAFRFTRVIDSASLAFFRNCCSSTSFASATLVKRVQIGDEQAPTSFLRIDFKDVLITSVSWDDGDMTEESCEFICREFALRYRKQNQDGSLDEPVRSTEWTAADSGWVKDKAAQPAKVG